MTIYTENNGVTTKKEFTAFDEVGWSLLDSKPVYRATVVEFSISEGIIRSYKKIVNADGSDYTPAYYKNFFNGLSLA